MTAFLTTLVSLYMREWIEIGINLGINSERVVSLYMREWIEIQLVMALEALKESLSI